ncbi:unnamed protein product [Rotaria sordida]|uniref:Uncharacterized protein n=1 Tax=Rotaria sordida TaxID=392033 RepID=A0A819XR64_9BILA|nr:unnamed protein product [Rotaria sordida]CAF4145923.1 unnamed protein product [Rotaria sordida]
MKLFTDFVLSAQDIEKTVFAECRQATGNDSSTTYRTINITYPVMSLSDKIKISDNDSDDQDSNNATYSSNVIVDEPIDENFEEVRRKLKYFTCKQKYFEMEIVDLLYVEDKLLENIQAVCCWHRLRKITMEHDYPDEK